MYLILFAVLAVNTMAVPVEDTHLVTMRKAEMLEIVNCISESKNPILCDKFAECEMIVPPQVVIASDLCKKECVTGGLKKCSPYEKLFESHEIPSKISHKEGRSLLTNEIFDCIKKNTHMLTAEDKKMMVEFESCVRKLHDMSCRFPKHD